MRTHVFEREQRLARRPEALFPFFGDPFNLEAITPPWLRFRVLSTTTERIEEGTLIDYRLRLHGVPIRWRSRITLWEPPHRFVDEQLRGPYRLWRHLHTFEPLEPKAGGPAGTLARDRVEYQARGGPLVHRWLVAPDLRRIFDYRQAVLAERFGAQANARR